jgi:hypothetical protein
MVRIQGTLYSRDVCKATPYRGEGKHELLRQRVQESVRAVTAVRNTQVFQTKTTVLGDVRQETDRTSDGLSIATLIWRLGMMCIISRERIAFCPQVEEAQGEIFAMSPIALQFRYMRVPI